MNLQTHIAVRLDHHDSAAELLRSIRLYADRGTREAVEVAALVGDAYRLSPGAYPGFVASERGCIVIEPRG